MLQKLKQTKHQGDSCWRVKIKQCYLTLPKGWHKLFTLCNMDSLHIDINIALGKIRWLLFSHLGSEKENSPPPP
jgi:hypothetical protein